MDYELIFWCVLGAIGLVVSVLVILAPADKPVSRNTIRRLCGERTH
jgi:hypothetical protein